MKIPDRIAWTVDLLGIEPDDRILEIGCGPGVAVGLISERLVAGRITAIDRSATAVRRARERNAAAVSAGRAAVEQAELARFPGEPQEFGKAFAVNVNLFWTGPADAEGAVLRRVLRRPGLVLLVYSGPRPGDRPDVAPRVAATLDRHGFTTEVVRGPDGASVAISGRLGS